MYQLLQNRKAPYWTSADSRLVILRIKVSFFLRLLYRNNTVAIGNRWRIVSPALHSFKWAISHGEGRDPGTILFASAHRTSTERRPGANDSWQGIIMYTGRG